MNKGRVEAFTDAIVAIIVTIMILEFKTPDTWKWEGIVNQFPYLYAYAVGFLFVCVAWYNHHYMFSLAKVITKKAYWYNNFWLFIMSMLPIASAWTGKYPLMRPPEYFYFVIFTLWGIAFALLSKEIMKSNSKDVQERIKNMPNYKFLTGKGYLVMRILLPIMIYFIPPIMLLVATVTLIMMSFATTYDSDKICVDDLEKKK